MLVNMNEVLRPAKKNHYAVGLFNAVNLELARGIIAAAESSRSPVIMGTAEILLPYGPLEEVSYYLIPMAKKASVPVVVHLDHGLTYDTCIQALKLGFSSVMYDCSTDSYEENVRKVKEWLTSRTRTVQQSRVSSVTLAIMKVLLRVATILQIRHSSSLILPLQRILLKRQALTHLQSL